MIAACDLMLCRIHVCRVAKFGRVRDKNPVLKERLLSKPGGIEALSAAGFVKRQEADEVVYVCDNPSPALSKIKAMLEEALAAV